MLNYQKKLEEQLSEICSQSRKSLLLHACCAPCSSYVIEYLSEFFDITLLYFNPNISPEEEYRKRFAELERLIGEMPLKSSVRLMAGRYDTREFFDVVKGLEELPEGGERCFKCYRLRLEEAARTGRERGFDFFGTTLSISPHKNAEKLNLIGEELGERYGIRYLYGDFKKRNGYKRSIELSEIYGLYRQNYCGCVFSRMEAEKRGKG